MFQFESQIHYIIKYSRSIRANGTSKSCICRVNFECTHRTARRENPKRFVFMLEKWQIRWITRQFNVSINIHRFCWRFLHQSQCIANSESTIMQSLLSFSLWVIFVFESIFCFQTRLKCSKSCNKMTHLWHFVRWIFLCYSFQVLLFVSFICQVKNDVIFIWQRKNCTTSTFTQLTHTKTNWISSWFIQLSLFCTQYELYMRIQKQFWLLLALAKTEFSPIENEKQETIIRWSVCRAKLLKSCRFFGLECNPISSGVVFINTFKYSCKVLLIFTRKCCKTFQIIYSGRVQMVKVNGWHEWTQKLQLNKKKMK